MIKPCERCGKNFTAYPSNIKRGKSKYCSRLCSGFGKVEFNCLICKKKFTTHQCKLKIGKGKYCSRKCYEVSETGVPSWNKGISATWAIGNKYRLGKGNPNPNKMFGNKNHKWKGGITVGESNRKEYFRFKTLERHTRKNNADGSHTLEEWVKLKAKFGNRCLNCKKSERYITLTEDHVIPLSKGGSDYISNIQPLCKSCNCKKHTKTTDYRQI